MTAPSSLDFASPRESLDALADLGTQNLEAVIAIDSQSDEQSPAIPSTEGQRALAQHLRAFFTRLGFECEEDASANLVVHVPARDAAGSAPPVAFMTHLDTSRGTTAVPRLERVPAWDGSEIRYPANPRLHVSADNYPETRVFVGEDVLHGPGEAPVGLDDKLGMAEVMTLAQVLADNPAMPRPPLVLVFRPDEEIGRMAAVEGLAETLARAGVRYGYTNDGLLPFEINTENFEASRARVRVDGRPLALAPRARARRLALDVHGVKSHGATAKSEGYKNATVLCARAFAALAGDDAIVPLTLTSSESSEVDGRLSLLCRGDDEAALAAAEQRVLDALEREIEPSRWRGARLSGIDRAEADPAGAGETDGLCRLLAHLARFLAAEGGPRPLLSEESEGYEGYTNPYFVTPAGAGAGAGAAKGAAHTLDYRIRAFTREELTAREEHVRALCADPADPLPVTIEQQYVNMGPALAPYPELVRWAEAALAPLGVAPRRVPIRGGTGVDPFLARGIPVANLGTGYFAPESEKELTSRQCLARHVLWLCYLVQVIAGAE